jgi:hypothetical protein
MQDGFYRLNLSPSSASAPAEGSYSVEFQDGDGNLLFTRDFSPNQDSNHDPEDLGSFFLVLPWFDNTRNVVFRYQGSEIGRIESTHNAPTVSLIESAPLTNGEPFTLRWEAADADADVLQFMLEYSRDGGVTWAPLAPNLSGSEFQIDPALLPGTEHGRIRIAVTDGFNTAFAINSADLVIADKAPSVHIDGGADQLSIHQGEPIALLGMGTDLEDGPFEPDRYQWSSNLDGSLGSGDLLTNQALSVGEHFISLSATDSQGNTATDTFQVVVFPVEEQMEPLEAGPVIPRYWIALAGIAVLAMIALIFSYIRSRVN